MRLEDYVAKWGTATTSIFLKKLADSMDSAGSCEESVAELTGLV